MDTPIGSRKFSMKVQNGVADESSTPAAAAGCLSLMTGQRMVNDVAAFTP